MDQSHPGGQLHHLASPHYHSHHQASAQIDSHRERAYMHQQCQNTRSTQPKPAKAVLPQLPAIDAPVAPDPAPSSIEPKTHCVYAATLDASSGRIDTDLTSRFPISASSGNKYIFLLNDYNSNSILTEALCNQSDNGILQTYNKLHQYLVNRGIKPLLQRVDLPYLDLLVSVVALLQLR
jgi:hypothetical protein